MPRAEPGTEDIGYIFIYWLNSDIILPSWQQLALKARDQAVTLGEVVCLCSYQWWERGGRGEGERRRGKAREGERRRRRGRRRRERGGGGKEEKLLESGKCVWESRSSSLVSESVTCHFLSRPLLMALPQTCPSVSSQVTNASCVILITSHYLAGFLVYPKQRSEHGRLGKQQVLSEGVRLWPAPLSMHCPSHTLHIHVTAHVSWRLRGGRDWTKAAEGEK